MSTPAPQRLEQLIRFAQAGRTCFAEWPEETIRFYLRFHIEQGTLAHCVSPEGEITALGVGWQFNAQEAKHAGWVQQPFYWKPSNPAGDAFVIAQLIARKPEAILALIDFYKEHWPNWSRLKLMGVRRGRLIHYNPVRMLRKLHNQSIRKYYGQPQSTATA